MWDFPQNSGVISLATILKSLHWGNYLQGQGNTSRRRLAVHHPKQERNDLQHCEPEKCQISPQEYSKKETTHTKKSQNKRANFQLSATWKSSWPDFIPTCQVHWSVNSYLILLSLVQDKLRAFLKGYKKRRWTRQSNREKIKRYTPSPAGLHIFEWGWSLVGSGGKERFGTECENEVVVGSGWLF